MKKKGIIFFAIILFLSLVLAVAQGFSLPAETQMDGHESVEEKVISKATIEDDFTEDKGILC